ncbi:MAG: cyclophilin-like fold protein [Nitrosopumilaceae archaeon]
MSTGSVSKIEAVLKIKGKSELNFELKRHLAPKTVGNLTRSVPLEGNAHMMGTSFAYMETRVNTGGEKLRTQFKKGDVAFMATNGSICFFVNDFESTKSMTLIGKITSNIDALNEVKPGDVFLITQAG